MLGKVAILYNRVWWRWHNVCAQCWQAKERRSMAVVRNSSARATAPVAEAGRDFLVRRDIAFLNHGSYGARPRPVFAAYQRWQRELETEPVAFLGRRLSGLLADARAWRQA
jgi:hypothetical protein